MSDQTASAPKRARPEYRNLNVFKDLTTYKLPLPGILSILHRVSGAALFLFLPVLMLLWDKSVISSLSYEALVELISFKAFGTVPVVKVILLGLAWAFLHHLFAGIRFLLLDMHYLTDKESAKNSSLIVFVVSIILTIGCGLRMFGVI